MDFYKLPIIIKRIKNDRRMVYMQSRTDLAIENTETEGCLKGIEKEEIQEGDLKITRISVTDKETADIIGKPVGKYITIECLPITDNVGDLKKETEIIGTEIKNFVPYEGEILVAGLGNKEITPDALGVRSMEYILATRHIKGEFSRIAGLDRLRGVSVITTGVMGQTGIETGEIIGSIVKEIKPDVLIAVDALAAKEISRLGCTVQISNTGINPGSGVGNRRKGINQKNIGIPVIAVGIPTVVDLMTLIYDKSESMIVTPREIDLLIERGARLIGMAINCALQGEYDYDTLWELVS